MFEITDSGLIFEVRYNTVFKYMVKTELSHTGLHEYGIWKDEISWLSIFVINYSWCHLMEIKPYLFLHLNDNQAEVFFSFGREVCFRINQFRKQKCISKIMANIVDSSFGDLWFNILYANFYKQ